MERLIKELIAVEKKRNTLLAELNKILKKLISEEDECSRDKHSDYDDRFTF